MDLKTERQFQYGSSTTPGSNVPEADRNVRCAKSRSEVANHGANNVSAVLESGIVSTNSPELEKIRNKIMHARLVKYAWRLSN